MFRFSLQRRATSSTNSCVSYLSLQNKPRQNLTAHTSATVYFVLRSKMRAELRRAVHVAPVPLQLRGLHCSWSIRFQGCFPCGWKTGVVCWFFSHGDFSIERCLYLKKKKSISCHFLKLQFWKWATVYLFVCFIYVKHSKSEKNSKEETYFPAVNREESKKFGDIITCLLVYYFSWSKVHKSFLILALFNSSSLTYSLIQ